MESKNIGIYTVYQYSSRAIAIIGDTKPIKEKLKELGCKFNRNLSVGSGWICSKSREKTICEYLESLMEKTAPIKIKSKNTIDTDEMSLTQLALFFAESLKEREKSEVCDVQHIGDDTIITIFGTMDYIVSEMDIIDETYDSVDVIIDITVMDKQLSVIRVSHEMSNSCDEKSSD